MLIFAKRFLFVAAGLLVLAAIVLLCINLYLQSGGVQQRIRDSAQRALGAEVKIGSTMYLPWSGLVIRGIKIPDPENASMNFVEADALRVRFALGPLIERRFVVTECTLFQPKVMVRQAESGEWIIPLGRQRVEVAEAPRADAPTQPKGVSFKAELQHVRLRGGSVVVINSKSREVATLERTDIAAQIAPDHSAKGILEIGRSDFFGALKPRNIGGPFTWNGRTLEFPEIQGSLAGGKITGKYLIETGEEPKFTLALQLSGVLLRKLAEEAQVEPGKTEGFLQGSLDLAGDPRDTATFGGTGHFELVSARLRPVEFLVKLGELLQIDELQLLKLSDARIDATVHNERVQVDNVILKSDNLILRGSGPVRFNGKMNLDASLLVNRKIQQQLKSVLSKNFIDSEDPDYRELPFTVTGRIDNPKTDLVDKLIGAKVGQDVGGMLMNILRSGASQKPEEKKETTTGGN
ncbi:MAG TPA: AsmA-like C-terminal region-containing protein [Terrimicrobiaceae bacterium]|nr:AsmA-like C-terminal region-containing protein [Terrimicrobiaceae bacterium]